MKRERYSLWIPVILWVKCVWLNLCRIILLHVLIALDTLSHLVDCSVSVAVFHCAIDIQHMIIVLLSIARVCVVVVVVHCDLCFRYYGCGGNGITERISYIKWLIKCEGVWGVG